MFLHPHRFAIHLEINFRLVSFQHTILSSSMLLICIIDVIFLFSIITFINFISTAICRECSLDWLSLFINKMVLNLVRKVVRTFHHHTQPKQNQTDSCKHTKRSKHLPKPYPQYVFSLFQPMNSSATCPFRSSSDRLFFSLFVPIGSWVSCLLFFPFNRVMFSVFTQTVIRVNRTSIHTHTHTST